MIDPLTGPGPADPNAEAAASEEGPISKAYFSLGRKILKAVAYISGDEEAKKNLELLETQLEIEETEKKAAEEAAKKAQLDLNKEEGYEELVKEYQRYLLYTLPGILKAAKSDGDLQLVNFTGRRSRLKRLATADVNSNANLSTVLSRTANIKYLRKLPPNVLSSLVPMIKIYKEDYPNGIRDGAEGRKADLKTKKTYEVPFDDNILSVGTNQTIESTIFRERKGTLDIASIISFDYQFIGTNPAEAENCITAKLKLKFQSIDALLQPRVLRNGEDKLDFKYADLLNSSLREKPHYYRLKIKVGYNLAVPIDFSSEESESIGDAKYQEYILRLLEESENVYTTTSDQKNILAKNFADAIKEASVFLYVYPVSHELNFNENGTIDLEINYHGAVESSMSTNDANVLLQSEHGRTVYQSIQEKEKEKQNELKRVSREYEQENRAKDADYEKRVNGINEKFDKQLEILYKNNVKIYDSFMETLYNSGRVRSIDLNTGSLNIVEDGYFFWKSTKIKEDSDGKAAEQRLEETAPALNYWSYKPNSPDGKTNTGLEIILERVKKNIKGNAGNPSNSTPNTAQPSIQGFSKNEPPRINFIFLQDLILFGLQVLDEGDLRSDDIFVILGNIIMPFSKKGYNDIVSSEDISNISARMSSLDPTDPIEKEKVGLLQINLGYLPISLEYFNKWFIENIVKPGKIEWKLKNFLHDIMDLVRISVSNIFGINTYGVSNSRTLLGASTVGRTFGNLIRAQNDLDFRNEEYLGKYQIRDPNLTSEIIYLFVPSLITSNINPLNVAENDSRNIFTFTVGSNVGLLKKISYKKMDIPGVREARMQQEGETAAGILRMKYDANIEMYGPCCFRPGDIVIINPTFFTKETSRSSSTTLANDLGLGGIFMVLKTNSQASRDGLVTSLETVFQTYGTLEIRRAIANPKKEEPLQSLPEEEQNFSSPENVSRSANP